MAERTAYVNGEFVPESGASVSIYDRGFLSGLGVFERTRTFQGEIFHLDRHIARLYRSLKAIRLDSGLTSDEMHETTVELVRQNRELLGPDEDYFVGHYITRGPDTAGRATVVILCEPIGFHKFAHHYIYGGHVITTHIRAIPTQVWDPKIKSTSRMHLWLAEQQAQLVDPEAYALLLSPGGERHRAHRGEFLDRAQRHAGHRAGPDHSVGRDPGRGPGGRRTRRHPGGMRPTFSCTTS